MSEIATLVVALALLASAVSIGMLAYYSTGAPAVRHELHQLTATRAIEIHRGPVTTAQVAAERARVAVGSVVSLNPFRLSSSGDLAWARDVAKTDTDGQEERLLVYSLLAATTTNPNDTLRDLVGRERAVVETLVQPAPLASATDLTALRHEFRRQERGRWLYLLRNARSAVDRDSLVPLASRGLDYIGRGTAAGLLAGMMVTTRGGSVADLTTAAGTSSLVGGAVGSTMFLASLLSLRPPPADQSRKVATLLARHPYWTTVFFLVAAACAIWGVRDGAPLLSDAFQRASGR